MGECIIYQVKPEHLREYGFRGLAEIRKEFGAEDLPRECWEEVYRFKHEMAGDDPIDDLEFLYEIFNVHRPADFAGHSMSVSDIVQAPYGLYFCDSRGWKPVKWKEAQT